MRNFFIGIIYVLYMIIFYVRGLIAKLLIRIKGEEATEKYKTRKIINWANFTVKILGLRVKYEGQEKIPREACVFVSNHQSILDIPILLLGVQRSIGFIAKKELLKVPVIGFWLQLGHCVPIDRENIREAMKVINEGVENLKSGYSMAIFPEGTRAKNGKIIEFKKGSLKLATKANVPIVPVTIDGAFKAYELNGKFKSADVKVRFGDPIYPSALSKEEQNNLSKTVHDIIALNLNQL